VALIDRRADRRQRRSNRRDGIGVVHRSQQPLWIADCDADEGHAVAGQRLKNLDLGYRSFCGLPLSTPYRRIGVFGLASLQPNSFTAEDVAFLSQVASQLPWQSIIGLPIVTSLIFRTELPKKVCT